MKLLLDQNLSHKLVARIEARYPGSAHVKAFAAEREDDRVIWARCKRDGFVFVTKDHDFEDPEAHPGPPPKVILLLIGNTRYDLVMSVLTRDEARIRAFESNGERILRLK